MFKNFIQTYFISPIVEQAGFNTINTLVYGFIMVFVVYGLYELLKRLKVDINKYFLISLLPFILFGSSTRVIEDIGTYTSYWLVTPGIWITIALLTVISFLSCLLIDKKFSIPYWKPMLIIGLILNIYNFLLIDIVNWTGVLMIIGLTCIFGAFLYLLYVKKLFKLEYSLIMSVHFFDASATFISIGFFNYFEQHVLPNVFISAFGPSSMFLMKFLIIFPVLVLVNKYSDEEYMKKWLFLCIFILGLAPALRDTIRLGTMT